MVSQRHRATLAITLALAAGFGAGAQAQCGGIDAPCEVAEGGYHVALPDSPAGAPAVLWLHGYASSGRNAVKNAGFAAAFTARGYALIAPNGQQWVDTGKLDWGVVDGHHWARDDIAFLKAVMADALPRFGLDPDRVLAAGFSRGGSLVWDLACHAPETASAFAASAGAFWEPMAERCAAPVHLHHSHGFKDRLVPFEGREVTFQGIDFHQGNVMKAVEVLRGTNGCMGSAEASEFAEGAWVKRWSDCKAGSLVMQITTGGHGFPAGWQQQILDWFETLDTD